MNDIFIFDILFLSILVLLFGKKGDLIFLVKF